MMLLPRYNHGHWSSNMRGAEIQLLKWRGLWLRASGCRLPCVKLRGSECTQYTYLYLGETKHLLDCPCRIRINGTYD